MYVFSYPSDSHVQTFGNGTGWKELKKMRLHGPVGQEHSGENQWKPEKQKGTWTGRGT